MYFSIKNKQKFYPWLILLCVGILPCILENTFTNVISLFLDPMVKSLNVSLAQISFFYTIVNFSMAFAMPLVAKFISRVNLKLTLLLVVIVGSTATAMLSLANNICFVYIIAGMLGFCCGFSGQVVQSIVINNWFDKKKNFAFIAASFVATIYLIIMIPLTSFLIQKLSWQHTFLFLAGICLILGIPAAAITRLKPQDIGLLPYGFKKEKQQDKKTHTASTPTNKTIAAIIFSASFIIVLLFFIFIEFAANITQLFPTYAIKIGFGVVTASLMPTVMNFADLFITPLFAYTSEKFGGLKSIFGWIIVGIVSLIILIFATITKLAPLAIFAAIPADILGTLFGSGESIFAQEVLKDNFDVGFSYAQSITYIIGAFAVPVLSIIYETSHSFNILFLFGILLLVAMLLLIIIVKKFRQKL